MTSGLFSFEELDKVESNRVSYELYIDSAARSKALQAVEPAAVGRSWLGLYLASFCCRVERLVCQWTEGYVWQHERFNLKPVHEHDMERAHLRGRSDFGDAIDDEWFIVFLLYKISEAFSECVISVQDNDGQFLLIEAADLLPKWMDAETSLNRVFIHRGQLHIISRTIKPGSSLSLAEAVATIASPTLLTEASQAIQQRIRERLAKFYHEGVFAKSHYHHAHCKLPKRIAYALSRDCSLVAPAVNAFMQGTLAEGGFLKATADPVFFPCVPTDNDFVVTLVKFTRLLFAQILSQQLPALSIVANTLDCLAPGSPDYLAAELGLKLTIGFELLHAGSACCLSTPKPMPVFALTELAQAWKHCWPNDGAVDADTLGALLAKVMTRHNDARSQLQALLARGVSEDSLSYVSVSPADSLDWLNIDPRELEQMLHNTRRAAKPDPGRPAKLGSRKKARVTFDEENLAQTSQGKKAGLEALEDMTRHFEAFLGRESDYEGIELSDDEEASFDSGADSSSVSDSEEANLEQEILETIQHDPDLLMKMIERSQEHGMDYKELLEKLKHMPFEFDNDMRQVMTDDSGEEDEKDAKSQSPTQGLCDDDDGDKLSSDDDGRFMDQYFGSMQHELQSLYKRQGSKACVTVEQSESEEELDALMDSSSSSMPSTYSSEPRLKTHVVQNVLHGFEAQEGRSGPSSTLLSSLGIVLPRNEDR